jgi:Xaa-Pro aminopeptidase
MYMGGPSLVWYEAGAFTLITMDSLAATAVAFNEQPQCQVVSYRGYSFTEQPAGAELLAQALREIVVASGREGTVGLEMRHVPAFLAEVVREGMGTAVTLQPIDNWLTPYRIIRTEEELTKMRQNFALIEVGQAAAKTAVQPGNTELDVWYAIHTAMQEAAQATLPLGNDCTVGRRMGGPPQTVEILLTDSFIVDLSTIWQGYWSDSCVTYYATDPSPKQAKMHRIVAEALDLAIDLARPGALAREIDQKVRQFITDAGFPDYPHHTGHGIGVLGHDAPRIVPHSDELLQVGMVIMLEPGIYYPEETGVRLEHAVLIQDGPGEILTKYNFDL